jgi:hypothetical protein
MNGSFLPAQCAACIRERSMIDHAITQMDSDDEDCCGEEDPKDPHDDIGGSCFHISIEREHPNARLKKVSCTRLNSRKKSHCLQIVLPNTILQHFKSIGRFGDVYELRTEVVIDGKRYRAHPNYRGGGPWYDFVMVHFELHTEPDYRVFVDDNNQYPAKLVAFFRLLPIAVGDETEFQVLAHCGGFQRLNSEIYSRRTLLVRSWLYDVTEGRNPRPYYQQVGSVRSNICVKDHIFAIEENPGFHERYPTDVSRRILVISDMRKEWPRVFMEGKMNGEDE